MVVLGSQLPDSAVQSDDLRWRAGRGVAIAWMLVQLWQASPFPYLIKNNLGLTFFLPFKHFALLHLALAAAAGFLLFNGRWLRAAWLNLLLAIIAVLVLSYPIWEPALGIRRDLDMRTLTREPVLLDLTAMAIALVMMVLLAGRIFGRLGAIAALLIVFPPSTLAQHWDSLSFTVAGVGAAASTFLKAQLVFLKTFGWVTLAASAAYFFLFVSVGASLDYMGLGNRLSAASAQFLNRGRLQEAARLSGFLSGRVFAAAFTLAMFVGHFGDPEWDLIGGHEALVLFATGASLYLATYLLGALPGWNQDGISKRVPRLGSQARALLHWMALVFVVTAVLFGLVGQAMEALVAQIPLAFGGVEASLVLMGLAVLTAGFAVLVKAKSAATVLRVLCAALPVLTFHWLVVAEGVSPVTAALFAVVSVVFCLLGLQLVDAAAEGRRVLVAIGGYVKEDLPALCVSTARWMAGVALIAAAFWPILNWWDEIERFAEL